MPPEELAAVDSDDSVESLGNFIADEMLGEQANPEDANSPESVSEEPVEQEVSEEAEETEVAEAEPEEDLEIADNLSEFAEQVGLEVEDLMGLKAPVKVNGEERLVTIADALAGHTMEADYRQKTAAVAEDKRLLTEAIDMATNEWQSRLSQVDSMREVLEEMITQEEASLDQYLQEGDTEGYLQAKRYLDARQARLQEVRSQRDAQIQEANGKTREQQANARRSEQQKLLSALPELRDPAKLQQFQSDMSAYLKGVGYSEQEISGWMGGAFDHRQVKMISDAMKRANAVKAQPALRKKLKPLRKVLKPGVPADAADIARNRAAELKKRVRQSGGNDRDLTSQLFEDFA